MFVLNLGHANQQNLFYTRFLALSNTLIEHGRWDSVTHPVLYPMWGYSILLVPGILMHAPELWILSLQFGLSLVVACWAVNVFGINLKWNSALLFLPFFAAASVKWPDAFVFLLLIPHLLGYSKYSRTGKLGWLILSSGCLALIVNLRSEYLLLGGIELATVFILTRNRRALIWAASSLAIPVVSLLFWSANSRVVSGQPRLSSSNGWSVFYISLGQLPKNPWDIAAYDSTAYRVAQSQRIDDPYSASGDSLFRRLSIAAVEKWPLSYGEKVGYNLLKGLAGGLYMGEAGSLFLDVRQRAAIDGSINSASFRQTWNVLRPLPAVSILLLSVEKILRAVSSPLLLGLIMLFLLSLRDRRFRNQPLFIAVLSLLIFRLATVSLVQYEPRHMNAVYLPLLLCSLLYWKDRHIDSPSSSSVLLSRLRFRRSETN